MSSLKINKQNMHMNIYLILDDSWCLLGFEYSNVTALKHTEVKKNKIPSFALMFLTFLPDFSLLLWLLSRSFSPVVASAHRPLQTGYSGQWENVFHLSWSPKKETRKNTLCQHFFQKLFSNKVIQTLSWRTCNNTSKLWNIHYTSRMIFANKNFSRKKLFWLRSCKCDGIFLITN